VLIVGAALQSPGNSLRNVDLSESAFFFFLISRTGLLLLTAVIWESSFRYSHVRSRILIVTPSDAATIEIDNCYLRSSRRSLTFFTRAFYELFKQYMISN